MSNGKGRVLSLQELCIASMSKEQLKMANQEVVLSVMKRRMQSFHWDWKDSLAKR